MTFFLSLIVLFSPTFEPKPSFSFFVVLILAIFFNKNDLNQTERNADGVRQ